jgi:hypothetical protein
MCDQRIQLPRFKKYLKSHESVHIVIIKKNNYYIQTAKAAHNTAAKARKANKYCATLSNKQRKTCRFAHHGTVIKELYHDGSWHYGVEVCAECGRYIKFVPWPQHLWPVRDKIRGNWSKQHPQQLPLLREPLCEHCGKSKRQWGSTWCDAYMWELIKDNQ